MANLFDTHWYEKKENGTIVSKKNGIKSWQTRQIMNYRMISNQGKRFELYEMSSARDLSIWSYWLVSTLDKDVWYITVERWSDFPYVIF